MEMKLIKTLKANTVKINFAKPLMNVLALKVLMSKSSVFQVLTSSPFEPAVKFYYRLFLLKHSSLL